MNWRRLGHGLTKDADNYDIKGKKAELQLLRNLREINKDNLSNIRREDSKYFGIIEKAYLKDIIIELATNNENNNNNNNREVYRGID
jgi:hypothetical protein